MVPRKSLPIFLAAMVLWTCSPTTSNGFSDTGHHVIAVIAFELLTPAEQAELIRILKENPRLDEDFTIPESISGDSKAIDRWLIGIAGEWPDIIRRNREFDRPTWHYQLGANIVVGNTTAPENPGPVPENATPDTQDLYISQAIELNRRILADASRPASERAVAICWLAHLVADSHQPCHAGSLYSEIAFPEGDRGANSIRLNNGRNMHALWDGLLGRNANPGDVGRRANEITSDIAMLAAGEQSADDPADLNPDVWLEESRRYAVRYVYTPEVLEAIQAVERGLTPELPSLTLSEEYLSTAGKVAKLRASQAGHRLAQILKACLAVKTNE